MHHEQCQVCIGTGKREGKRCPACHGTCIIFVPGDVPAPIVIMPVISPPPPAYQSPVIPGPYCVPTPDGTAIPWGPPHIIKRDVWCDNMTNGSLN